MRAEVHHPESLGIQDCERHARDKLLLMDMHEEDRKRERQGAVIMKIFTALWNWRVRHGRTWPVLRNR